MLKKRTVHIFYSKDFRMHRNKYSPYTHCILPITTAKCTRIACKSYDASFCNKQPDTEIKTTKTKEENRFRTR